MNQSFTHFRVLYYGKKNKYYPIEQLTLLADYIQEHGLLSIHQIIFEFPRSPLFPYTHHNISLCNTKNGIFTVQFYHYHNCQNQLITMDPENQYQDYYQLVYLLYHHPQLQRLLLPYVDGPLFLRSNDLKE